MSNFFRGRKVLVTGGAGLIGSAFVEQLLDLGAQVRAARGRRPIAQAGRVEVVQGDLRLLPVAREACRGVDFVVHAAGVSGGSKQVSRDPIPMFTDSLWMNTVVMEAARLEHAARYLFVSNSSVYPAGDRVLSESDGASGPPENETGMVKRAGESQCAVYARSTDMKIAIIRSGNAYGPWDNFDLDSSHVAPALIAKAVQGTGPLVLWGDGKARRDFIHTADIARGGLFLLEHHAIAEPVNIATGRIVTIGELARIILNAAGRPDAAIEYTGTSPAAPPAKELNLTRMRQLGFAPQLTLEQGVAQTVAWHRASIATAGIDEAAKAGK